MKKKIRKLFKSTFTRIFLVVILFVLPVNILTLVLSQQSAKMEQEEIEKEATRTLSMAMQNFSDDLKEVARKEIYLSFSNDAFLTLEDSMYGKSNSEKAQVLKNAETELDEILQDCKTIDIVYCYFPNSGYTVTRGSSGVNRNECLGYIEKMREDNSKKYGSSWYTEMFEGQLFLVSCAKWHGAEYGVFVNLERAIKRLKVELDDESIAFFCDGDEELLAGSGQEFLQQINLSLDEVRKSGAYNVYEVSDEERNIKMIELSRNSDMWQGVSKLTRTFVILSILFTVLAIPLILFFENKWILEPLNRLTKAIGKIEQGDLTYRIEEKNTELEFEKINHSFNMMMEEVSNLKIDVYEKELEKKNITMRYLSQQIQPHFILNAMNILYSYEPEEYELSQKMILCISKYFRYIVNANEEFVSLGMEMAHIENYFEIQKARYPDMFYSIVEYDESLEEALLPPLLVQNFAENSIKHSLKTGNKITIYVITEHKKDKNGADIMRIRLADTGEGISDEILNEIKAFQETGIKQEHLGIGVQNSIERLKYLYEEPTAIRFWRDENYRGTNIEIILPVHYRGEEDEDTVG